VTVVGQPLVQSSELITSAVLKGVLSQRLSEPVNLVNAPVIARELGVSLEEKREMDGGSFTHLIKVEYESEQGKRMAAGTVFENSLMRIVQMDGYRLEIVPEGTMLFYKNIDKPGMLAAVGSILASEGINIAGLALGRDEPGQRALTIINVDSPIRQDIIRKMEMIEGVFEVRSAKL
jgi:D-3-phosphoglycerate dehydrogenase